MSVVLTKAKHPCGCLWYTKLRLPVLKQSSALLSAVNSALALRGSHFASTLVIRGSHTSESTLLPQHGGSTK